jgi:hypothetical protein
MIVQQTNHEQNYKQLIVCVVGSNNRLEHLEALVSKLVLMPPIENKSVLLRISIDGPINEKVMQFSQKWRHFQNMSINLNETNLGIVGHVMTAANWCAQRGDFLMLEEDLDVSGAIIDMTLLLLGKYRDSKEIRQVSLYSIDWNEFNRTLFYPMSGGVPVYLARTGSSLGQAWTSSWWREFYLWYENNRDIDFFKLDLPLAVRNWPSESSWKKYFNAFLVCNSYLVAYPVDTFSRHTGLFGFHCSGDVAVLRLFKRISDYLNSETSLPSDSSIKHYYDQHLKLVSRSKDFVVQERRNTRVLELYSVRQLVSEIIRRIIKNRSKP